MDSRKYTDFMSKHGIIYLVIVDLESYAIVSFGWSYKLPYAGLLDLFHDEESIKSLNDSLEGEIMPQAMRQGEVKCLICKPKNDMLVGLFYLENRDVAEAYKFGEQLNEELSELLK
ncbi:hypothetical protein [Pelosinus fermentans]|nr:hypothetical protein [Pelosinus fermentans]